MADIELVIKIDKKEYDLFIGENYFSPNITRIKECLANGTPLPKGHGRLIDADKLFMECHTVNGYMCIDEVVNTPTIIEADKKESEGV